MRCLSQGAVVIRHSGTGIHCPFTTHRGNAHRNSKALPLPPGRAAWRTGITLRPLGQVLHGVTGQGWTHSQLHSGKPHPAPPPSEGGILRDASPETPPGVGPPVWLWANLSLALPRRSNIWASGSRPEGGLTAFTSVLSGSGATRPVRARLPRGGRKKPGPPGVP